MLIKALIIIVLALLIVNLAVLFIVFDTIKRTKGKFNQGLKVLFFAFSFFFLIEIYDHLTSYMGIRNEVIHEMLELIFMIVILLTLLKINNKVKEVNHNNKHNSKGKNKAKK